MIKKKFTGRGATKGPGAINYGIALAHRPVILLELMGVILKDFLRVSCNIYKQVKMYKNSKVFIPPELWSNSLYTRPYEDTFRLVKTEQKKRKEFKNELNEFKQQPKTKKRLKAKLEQVAFEGKEDGKGHGEKCEDNNI